MSKNFTRWVKDNEERIAYASSLTYFLADNGKVSNGKYRYFDLMLTANVVQPAIWDSVITLMASTEERLQTRPRGQIRTFRHSNAPKS